MQGLPEETPARYVVGIDLGTTNSALAYVDTLIAHPEARVRDFPVRQVVAPGEVEARAVLPSFGYEPGPGEFPPGALGGPGNPGGGYLVGWLARRHGAQVPGRLVASAKSWLCHPGVNRTAPLLPWHGLSDVTRISPVDASARYLAHLRAAWDEAFPQHPLADQEVVVTVPASFDEVARELTVQAAAKAGLEKVTLLEEPQAAFYSWMATQGTAAEDTIEAGQLTLVCDVGGGTSDFTLIEARRGADGLVRFHRVAVGDHLILGGDNMDLALAHHVENRIGGGRRLEARLWGLLVQACRGAKETLLAPDAPERTAISIAAGARLVGGALQIELTRDEARALLVDGFFPRVPADARPASARSGFQEFGLPYAADAAVTRHLAAFLADHARAGGGGGGGGAGGGGPAPGAAFPDRVLFNGGVFESVLLRERLLEVLEAWRREVVPPGSVPASARLDVLPNERLDLAVARGAAYAAWLRRRGGRRIAAGLARAYLIQVGREAGEAPTAVCLAPAGLEEGQEVVVPQRFSLRLREPVEFALFSSSTRVHDRPGDLVAIDPEQLSPLPPVRTVVGSGRSREVGNAEVQLQARLTEVGTLDVRCLEVEGRRSWKLEFDVRGTARRGGRPTGLATPAGDAPEEALVAACRERIRRVFAPAPEGGGDDPASLVRGLEELSGLNRDRWPLPLLRGLWAELFEVEAGRRRGVMHEARWLNLLGFALRPGFGYPVDDWRVQRTWRLFSAGTVFPRNEMCRAEWCILWRRIAGGLGTGHQRALADAFAVALRPRTGKKVHYGPHETAEIWRLLGALELLPIPVKEELGAALADRLERRIEPSLLRAAAWAWGRVGARVPAYGPLNGLVPADVAEAWVRRLILQPPADSEITFAAVQLARSTGDRYRDLPEEVRAAVGEWLERNGAPPAQVSLVREGGEWDAAEEEHVVGESLPPGLHLRDATEA